MTTARDKEKDPLAYMSTEEWSNMGEDLEPDWDTAHKPKLKTEVITVRLGAADLKRLKAEADRMGIGHSTLARMILRQALRERAAGIEEAVSSEYRLA